MQYKVTGSSAKVNKLLSSGLVLKMESQIINKELIWKDMVEIRILIDVFLFDAFLTWCENNDLQCEFVGMGKNE